MKNNNELLSSLKPTLMTLMVLKVKQGENMDYGWNPAVEREKKNTTNRVSLKSHMENL